MIAAMQLLIKYALFEPFLKQSELTVTLNGFGFGLLVAASLCLAAAGNIINDIVDVETDQINKPSKVIVGSKISEKRAYQLFFTFNIIGVLLGFYLSHLIGKNGFFAIFVIISALLYVYATYLKQTFLIGNIVVSLLVAFSILIVGVFELSPVITPENHSTQNTFFKIVLDYAVFAFLLNFVREIVKDLEDVDGDHNAGMRTLPIVLGRERTAKIVAVVNLMPLFATIYYVATYLYKFEVVIAYFLITVIAPLIYISVKIYGAKTKKQYHHVSTMLKLVMLFGMFSMLLYPFVLI